MIDLIAVAMFATGTVMPPPPPIIAPTPQPIYTPQPPVQQGQTWDQKLWERYKQQAK